MVNNIVDGTSTLIEQVKEHLKRKVLTCVNGKADELTAKSVEDIFDSFEDPFTNLKTSYLQSSFLESNPNFVHPIQYILSTRLSFKNKGPKRVLSEQHDTMVYVPILESIQQLLSNPKIAAMIMNQQRFCRDGYFFDVCDGECFKNNEIFQEHPDALQIILYHDEVEICNPLGTHTGKHKVDLYYYTLGNICPKHRSKLCAIRLLAIVKAEDVSRYGQNKVLTPIINDLNTLANGHTFVISGKSVELFGAVVSCLGDTEGQHQWGGFKVKVGFSHQKCRNCLCTFVTMQENFRDNCFTQRNIDQYHMQCQDIETAPTEQMRKDLESTYGIEERSLLSKLPHFDITQQLPQDLMHILLEGSVQYEVRYILNHFIESGFITLTELNNKFAQLKLGYRDEANRPLPLKETIFKGQEKYKFKQTAEQARIFLKYLLFCLTNTIPNNNPFYQLLLQITSIVQISFSPVISKGTIKELQDLIERHLLLFKELFPDVNVTPKMHYMLHIPRQIELLGPLVRHCCMRFEARHKYFKELGREQNFKNICLSLAEHCQLDDCADFTTERPSQHPLFSTDMIFGPNIALTNEIKTVFAARINQFSLYANPEMLKNLLSYKWIELHGTKYDCSKCCVIAVNATFISKLPIFGRLQRIWLADEDVIFEITPLRTLQFDKNVLGYEVEDPGNGVPTEYYFYKRMLDYNLYSLQEVRGTSFIPLKYDLRDIIDLHVVGENPLHF